MKKEELRFNIRVYGILVNENREVLLSSESRKGFEFTKFPGGGMEWGEGSRDCLEREIREELGLQIEIKNLFYLTEHFQKSAFREGDQLVSIYYLIDSAEKTQIKNGDSSKDPEEEDNHFFWHPIDETKLDVLTFPIDREVFQRLKETYLGIN